MERREVASEPESRTGRYGLLLAVLIGMLLGVPPLSETGHEVLAMAVGFPALFLVCALAIEAGAVRGRVLALAGVLIGGDVLLHVFRPEALVVGIRLLAVGFLGLVAGLVLARILREERVRVDTIVGGICVYLLLGLLFHSIFNVVEFVWPGSFAYAGTPLSELAGADASRGRYAGLVYYSFVTLTTLGYGDVVSTWALPQVLSTAEAVTGQLYLAILIASLVGMHLVHRSGQQS